MPTIRPPTCEILAFRFSATEERVFSASSTKMTPSAWGAKARPSGESANGGESTMIRLNRFFNSCQKISISLESKISGVKEALLQEGLTCNLELPI